MEASTVAAGPPRTPVRSSTRSAAAAASTVATPTSAAGPSSVPLESLEAPDPLPAPPVAGATGTSAAAATKRAVSEAASAPGAGRAKRTRPNVKYSPAKTGKVARGRLATSSSVAPTRLAASQPEPAHVVGESCEVCGTAGLYVCCDGCPRVFHPLCVDPPLLGVEEAGDHWFCRECTVSRVPPIPPPKSLFSKLILKAELENPSVFKLPRSLRSSYENVGTHPQTGDYVDEGKLRGKPKLDAKGYAEEPDPYRTKTKDGRSILCFMCGQAASLAKKKRIISCDSCEQHFHLDCLDPPLAAPPPSAWKWTCPLHADKAAPKKRVPKHSVFAKIDGPNKANNGDIEVLARPEKKRGPMAVEEIVQNRLRFQVPEDVIVLDFWAKLKGEHQRGDDPRLAEVTAVDFAPTTRESSPLTPLSSLESSPEPPVLGRDLLSAASSSRLSSVVSERSPPRHREPFLPGLTSGSFSRISSRASSEIPAFNAPTLGLSLSNATSRDSPALSSAPLNGRRSSTRHASRSSAHPFADAGPLTSEPSSKLDELARIALEMDRSKVSATGASRTPKRIRIKGTKYLDASNASLGTETAGPNTRAGSLAPAATEPLPSSQTNSTLDHDVKGKGRAVNGTSNVSETSDASGPMLGDHGLDRRDPPSFAMSNTSPSPAPSVQERSSESNDAGLPSVQNPEDLKAIMRVRQLLASESASQRGGLLKFVAGTDSATPPPAWTDTASFATSIVPVTETEAPTVQDVQMTEAPASGGRPRRKVKHEAGRWRPKPRGTYVYGDGE